MGTLRAVKCPRKSCGWDWISRSESDRICCPKCKYKMHDDNAVDLKIQMEKNGEWVDFYWKTHDKKNLGPKPQVKPSDAGTTEEEGDG